MNFLANLPPDGFSPWLANAFYLVGLVTAALVLWRQVFPSSAPTPTKVQDPLNVKLTDQFVTLAQFEKAMSGISSELQADRLANKRDHDNIFTKIGGHERGINTSLQSISERLAKVDERSASTQSDMRLLRQDLQDFFKEQSKR